MRPLLLTLALLLALPAFAFPRDGWDVKDDQLEPLTVLLDAPPQCVKEAEKLGEDYRYYDIEGSDSSPEFALAQQRRILALIRKRLSRLETSPCFTPVATYYALRSYRERIRPLGHWEAGIANGWTKLAVLFFLAKQKHLIPIAQTERNQLGGVWSEKSGESNKIMGSYECSSGSIYFDPYAAPYDVAALLSHELDHLFRDKWLPLDVSRLRFADYLLVDETLASLHAALIESRGLSYAPLALPSENASGLPELRQFVDFDLTLFDRKGHAKSLAFDYIQLRRSRGTNNETDVTYEDKDISVSELLGSLHALPSAKEHIRGIFKVVAAAYFKNTHFNFDALTDWVISYGALFQPDSNWTLLTSRTEQIFTSPHPSDEEMNRAFAPGAHVFIAPIQSIIDQLRSDLTKVSPACQKFAEESRLGKLKNYLGSSLPHPGNPGDHGSRPGDHGSRPGTGGSRPCLLPQKGI